MARAGRILQIVHQAIRLIMVLIILFKRNRGPRPRTVLPGVLHRERVAWFSLH